MDKYACFNWWNSLSEYWKKKIVNSQSEKTQIFPSSYVSVENVISVCNNVKKISIYKEDDIEIPDLSFLQRLNSFTISQVNNISYGNLKTCKNLTYLELWIVPVSDISFLENCKYLKVLNLWSTLVKDLRPIENHKYLEELRFTKQYNDKEKRIDSISSIQKISSLKILHIGEDIQRIDSLAELQNLEEFSYRKVDDLNFLSELKKLKKIFVMGNNLYSDFDNVDYLSSLENLEHLDISFSKVKDVESLSKNKKLKKIVLMNTPLHKEYNNLFMRILLKTKIQKFKKKNKNCKIELYK